MKIKHPKEIMEQFVRQVESEPEKTHTLKLTGKKGRIVGRHIEVDEQILYEGKQ